MRKVLKPAKRCEKCNAVVEREEWGSNCDECGADTEACAELEVTVHRDDGTDMTTEDHHYCSWACLFKGVHKIDRRDLYFFSLPLVGGSREGEQIGVDAFLEMLREKDVQ